MLGLILIEPEERNKGLGKITHEALIKRAADLGAKTFRIGVIKENKEGIKFWNKLGYNHIKTVTMDFKGKNNKVNVMRYEIYN